MDSRLRISGMTEGEVDSRLKISGMTERGGFPIKDFGNDKREALDGRLLYSFPSPFREEG